MNKAEKLHRILTLLLKNEEDINFSSNSDGIMIGCKMPLNNKDIIKELDSLAFWDETMECWVFWT